MPPECLAAALASHPITARCRRCARRRPYAQMAHNNTYCRRCWAAVCRLYRYGRRP